MAQFADSFDLATLHLRPGEARVLDARVRVAPVSLGGGEYQVNEGAVEVKLDVSRTVSGYALRIRFTAALSGGCMRCLTAATPEIEVDAREIDQPDAGDDLRSPYLTGAEVDLAAWARDALVLALPAQIVCREDCRGLCAVCGANLNEHDPRQHHHDEGGDSRWAKLREIRFDRK